MLRLFAVSVGLNAGGMALAFVVNFVLARLAGPAETGIYAEALTWHILLATIGAAGADRLVVREIAHLQANNQSSIVPLLVRTMRFRALRWSFAIGGSLSMFWLGACLYRNSLEYLPLVVACAAAPFGSALVVNISMLHAFKRNKLAQFLDQLVKPTLVIVCFAFLWGINELAGDIAFVTYIVSACVCFGISFVMVDACMQDGSNQSGAAAYSSYNLQPWNCASTTLAWAVAVHALSTRLDVVLLGVLSTSFDVGLYHVAARIAVLSSVLLVLFNMILGPRAARMLADGEIAMLQQQISGIIRWICIATMPWFVLLVLFSQEILGLFGEEYIAADLVLTILAIAQAINIATGPAGTLLNAGKREKDLLASVWIGLLSSVVLLVTLIPVYGPLGAAVATASGIVLMNVYASIRVYQLFGINPTVFSTKFMKIRLFN